MLVIPAIDLRRGRCVRLYQGDPRQETVYGTDPVAVAAGWERQGAELLHLVDLDGAFSGLSANEAVIGIIAAGAGIPLQLGGGIRTREAVEKAFTAGISRVIIGTLAVEDPVLSRALARDYPGRIIVGIDARAGRVAVKGWAETTALDAFDFASMVEQWGVGEIIYTDIQRDGALTGPDLPGLERILAGTGLQVIMSGGISSLDDLRSLKPYRGRVRGVIVGKALYSEQFTLPEAIALFGPGQDKNY